MNALLESCHLNPALYPKREFKKNAVPSDELSGEKCAVYIEKGSLSVYAQSTDGKETLLTFLNEGEIFGINNLFYENESVTIIKCDAACSLVYIPKHILKNRVLSSSKTMEIYSALLNQKIQFLLGRIEALSASSSKAKLASFLLDHGEEVNMLSKSELADLLGISRATLFRDFKQLEADEAISLEGSSVCVTNRTKLETLYF